MVRPRPHCVVGPVVARISALALALGIASCGGKGESGTTGPTVGAPAKLAFSTQPGASASSAAINPAIQVTVEDASGLAVTSATNSVTVGIGTNPGGGTLSGTTTVAAVGGVATFTGLSIDKVGTGYTLAATAAGLTGTTSGTFNITPGAPARLAFSVQPTASASGAAISPAVQVTVLDAAGNTATGAANSITVAIGTNPASGTLSGTTNLAPAPSGVATFNNLSIDKAGTGYTLTAAATGLTGATSTAFSVTAAPASKLAFSVQPSTSTSATAINPAVQVTVQDAAGNTVTGATNSITVAIGTNPASGTLSGTSTMAAVSGVATFSTLSIDKAGTGYTLTAGATGLSGAASGAFNINVGAASKLAFSAQPHNLIVTGSLTPAVQVTILDAGGNTVTGATNSITAAIGTNAGGGTLSGTTSVAAASGVASFGNLSIDKAGTGYTLTAAATGLSGATSGTFNVIAFADVSTGFALSCGLTTGGAAYCWGDGSGGRLGNGTTSASSTPVPVSGGPYSAAGTGPDAAHACALTSGGTAYCWGYNMDAQLGDSTATGPQSCSGTACSNTPAAVAGGLHFTAIAPGGNQACALISGGAAYCWGQNNTGQLGDSTTAGPQTCGGFSCSIVPVRVNGGHTFSAITEGLGHTCALAAAGAAYCWGWNLHGQMGTGSTNSDSAPAAVSGGLAFAQLSAGGTHTCGVTTGGAAYCWGDNTYGELGNGTTSSSSSPVAVSGALTFAVVSAGDPYSCGVTTSGAAYCWGANNVGQLGVGSTTGPQTCNSSTACSMTPASVNGALTFSVVRATNGHTCGVTTAGAVYCWGSNNNGEVGDGSNTLRSAPVRVASP